MTIEYDPNRSSFISLIFYEDGEKRYILSPSKLMVGDNVISGENVPLKVGNSLPLKSIPAGYIVHNVELIPGKGGQLVRSAGNSAQIMALDSGYCTLKLPQMRLEWSVKIVMPLLVRLETNPMSKLFLEKLGELDGWEEGQKFVVLQ